MRDIVDNDPEKDVYTLDFDTLSRAGEHRCGNSGVEFQVKQLRKVFQILMLKTSSCIPVFSLPCTE